MPEFDELDESTWDNDNDEEDVYERPPTQESLDKLNELNSYLEKQIQKQNEVREKLDKGLKPDVRPITLPSIEYEQRRAALTDQINKLDDVIRENKHDDTGMLEEALKTRHGLEEKMAALPDPAFLNKEFDVDELVRREPPDPNEVRSSFEEPYVPYDEAIDEQFRPELVAAIRAKKGYIAALDEVTRRNGEAMTDEERMIYEDDLSLADARMKEAIGVQMRIEEEIQRRKNVVSLEKAHLRAAITVINETFKERDATDLAIMQRRVAQGEALPWQLEVLKAAQQIPYDQRDDYAAVEKAAVAYVRKGGMYA